MPRAPGGEHQRRHRPLPQRRPLPPPTLPAAGVTGVGGSPPSGVRKHQAPMAARPSPPSSSGASVVFLLLCVVRHCGRPLSLVVVAEWRLMSFEWRRGGELRRWWSGAGGRTLTMGAHTALPLAGGHNLTVGGSTDSSLRGRVSAWYDSGSPRQRKKEATGRKMYRTCHFPLTSGSGGKFLPTPQNLELAEHPLRYSTKTMELGPGPPFFE
jgi:hypothetical protein